MPSILPSESWVLVYRDIRGLHPLMEQLQNSGLAVRAASGAAQILDMAAQSPMPSAIILDTGMKDVDGLSLCRALKTASATHHIPIFFLTDAGDPVARVDGLKAGAADYIVHPCEPWEVLLRLRMHMAAPDPAYLPAAASSAGNDADGLAWSREQELVWAAQQYLAEGGLATALTHHELARLMGTSESVMSAAFLRVSGMSAYEYLRVQRFETAAALLRSGIMRIADIAEQVGYSDSANFATAFRGYTGMPPTAYRERWRRTMPLDAAQMC